MNYKNSSNIKEVRMNLKTEIHLERLKQCFKNKQMLSKADIATYLNISVSSVNNLMINNESKLSYLKLGDNKRAGVKIHIDDFAIFLESIEQGEKDE
jgi:predicted XRE-type DNA-binding protein